MEPWGSSRGKSGLPDRHEQVEESNLKQKKLMFEKKKKRERRKVIASERRVISAGAEEEIFHVRTCKRQNRDEACGQLLQGKIF